MSIGVDSPSVSQHLSASHSSIHPNKKVSSEISKTYKHVSQLYLTRQLKEAYDLLQPVIRPPKPSTDDLLSDDQSPQLAPIALATTSQRIKIWSLYITLMNEICELGQEYGSRQFGSRYRGLQGSATQGHIWEQVVRDGYQGREGSVDAEVVYNLSNLLLGQAKDQKLNQERLESYLASSSAHLDLDLSTHVTNSLSSSRISHMSGTNTPKDLSSRIRILELFTLHVLPRNDEWDYAKSFVTNSDILDDERKEAFLQTLQELQDGKEEEENMFTDAEDGLDASEDEVNGLHEAATNGITEEAASSRSPERESPSHKKTSSEIDYGIDQTRPKGHITPKANGLSASAPTNTTSQPPPPSAGAAPALATSKPTPPTPSSTSVKPTNSKSSIKSSASSSSSKPKSRSSPKAVSQPKTTINRIQRLVGMVYHLTSELSGSLVNSPAALVKTMMFIIGLLALFGRRDARERILQTLRTGWMKVKGTAGMGMKVSYI